MRRIGVKGRVVSFWNPCGRRKRFFLLGGSWSLCASRCWVAAGTGNRKEGGIYAPNLPAMKWEPAFQTCLKDKSRFLLFSYSLRGPPGRYFTNAKLVCIRFSFKKKSLGNFYISLPQFYCFLWCCHFPLMYLPDQINFWVFLYFQKKIFYFYAISKSDLYPAPYNLVISVTSSKNYKLLTFGSWQHPPRFSVL